MEEISINPEPETVNRGKRKERKKSALGWKKGEKNDKFGKKSENS